jgi:hypothetical protein
MFFYFSAKHNDRTFAKTWQRKSWSLVLRSATIMLLACVLNQISTASAQSKSCPLTEAQSQKAVAAFGKIAGFVLNEPRCVNCHGGVNPHIEGIGLDPEDANLVASLVKHGGGLVRRDPEDVKKGVIPHTCTDCHNHMANKTDGSPTKQWMTAAPFHNFVDKDATTLCRQFKKSLASAEQFLGHIKDDNGGNNFAQTAFNGDRGLDPDQYLDPDNKGSYVPPQPPSITKDVFLKLGQDWINAMGGKFQGDERCGCELKHDKWSGMIRYVLDTKGDEGHEKGPGWSHDWSSGSTTRIIVSLTNGVGTARYSVQGSQQHTNWRAGKPEWKILPATSSSKMETSGQGTFPAIADVVLSQGTYLVFEQLQLAGQSVRSLAGNPIIGKQHIENCDSQHGCTGADTADVYALPLPPLAPLKGTVQDPNHVVATITLKKDGLGMSHKGVSIETMTVDLWRSGSN